MSEGFAVLPHPDMSPAAAYEQLVLDNVEKVDLDGVAERTLATGIVPYPPGIPLIMPGENAGPADGPALGYLKALEGFDRQFPAFEHDSHGVEVENGKYYVTVLKKLTVSYRSYRYPFPLDNRRHQFRWRLLFLYLF